MNTNVSKKELQNLSTGLEMLADRQQEYLNAVGDIALVLHSNAMLKDTLKQPNNPELANELLSDLLILLSGLSINNSRFLQEQVATQNDILALKELQNN